MIELKKKYKSGSAVEILQEAILIGDIPEGTALTQNELAFSLGTSRMPVREALIALEYQGLIERQTNQHFNIIRMNDEYIRSVFHDMSLIETEALKGFSEDRVKDIASSCGDQHHFHFMIYSGTKPPLRRKMLQVMTEIYLSFVLNHTEDIASIDNVFANLLEALRKSGDAEVIRACYAVYSEVLSAELIRIRKRRKDNA